MTLQEKAFMCDLIKKTYRQRMFVFYLFVIVISIPILIILFWQLETVVIISLISISIVFFIIACLYYNQSKYLTLMPWALKRMQVQALEDYSKSDFEDLICSVPLKEFFVV